MIDIQTPRPPKRPPYRDPRRAFLLIAVFMLVLFPTMACLSTLWVWWRFWQGQVFFYNFTEFFDLVMRVIPFCFKSWGAAYPDYGVYLNTIRAVSAFQLMAPIFISIALAFYLTREIGPEIYIRGRKLSTVAEDANKEIEASRDISGAGINIHPDITTSIDLETKHFACVGSTGAGKTVVILFLLWRLLSRGDRCILFDMKPDFTSFVPGSLAILTPWDKRSYAWDIAADVISREHAETFAAMLIPSSKDEVFSKGARLAIQASIMECQNRLPLEWDITDLLDTLSDSKKIQKAIITYFPSAKDLLSDLESKPAQSLLFTISAYLGPLNTLAAMWKGKKKISIRRWLKEEGSEKSIQILILGGNKEYRSAEQFYMRTILQIATGIICGPAVEDNRNRKIWIVVDEIPQLGKQEDLGSLLAVGRSKGLRTILGFQDISQLIEIYSPPGAQTWESLITTWIICQIKGGTTPKSISDMLGKQEVYRYSETTQRQNGSGTKHISGGWQRAEKPVVYPEELTDTLGPEKDGINAILYVSGIKTVYRLKWPFPGLKKLRHLHVPQQSIVHATLHEDSISKKAIAIKPSSIRRETDPHPCGSTAKSESQDTTVVATLEEIERAASHEQEDPWQNLVDELAPEVMDVLSSGDPMLKKKKPKSR